MDGRKLWVLEQRVWRFRGTWAEPSRRRQRVGTGQSQAFLVWVGNWAVGQLLEKQLKERSCPQSELALMRLQMPLPTESWSQFDRIWGFHLFFVVCFFCLFACFVFWSGACQVDQIGRLVRLRGSPAPAVSDSPAQGLQVHLNISAAFYMVPTAFPLELIWPQDANTIRRD